MFEANWGDGEVYEIMETDPILPILQTLHLVG